MSDGERIAILLGTIHTCGGMPTGCAACEAKKNTEIRDLRSALSRTEERVKALEAARQKAEAERDALVYCGACQQGVQLCSEKHVRGEGGCCHDCTHVRAYFAEKEKGERSA